MKIAKLNYIPFSGNNKNILKKGQEFLSKPQLIPNSKPSNERIYNTEEDFEAIQIFNKSMQKIVQEYKHKSQQSIQSAEDILLD